MRKSGFTLVEVLVAISLFALVALISSNILVGVFHLERRTGIENGLYEDVQLAMQQLTSEIQNGAIDYEEYYSINVIQGAGPERYYGLNYGIYASRFYDPGQRWDGVLAQNPRDLGLECTVVGADGNCRIYWTNSADLNTGSHPFDPNGIADAFCEGALCQNFASKTVDELYLIDKTGSKKTILLKRKTKGDDFALGLMRMEGADYDQNGVIDLFSCEKDFNCDAAENLHYPFENAALDIEVPKQSDKDEEFSPAGSQFVPITPLRSSVKNLQFIISPTENPYNAYAEKGAQFQPTVTIILTMGLSEAAKADYPGDFPDITVQTTVAAGVKEKLISYPPVDDRLKQVVGADFVTPLNAPDSWIEDVLGPMLGL